MEKLIGDTAADGQVIEESRIIPADQFDEMVALQRNSHFDAILQTRHSFVWRGHYFEVKINHKPSPGLAILYCSCPPGGEQIEFPPWLEVGREITDNLAFV